MSRASDPGAPNPGAAHALTDPQDAGGRICQYRDKHPGSSIPHMLFHDACALSAQVACMALWRHRAYGIASVPRTGPLLIVANHQSFLDPPLIGAPLHGRRHLDYIARIGLFRNRLLGSYLIAVNSIPIRQDEPDAGAIREALRRLAMGRAVVVFAEGSRTDDGRVRPFKRGLAVLVRRARCPILPVAIEGAFNAWPRSRTLPRVLRRWTAVRYLPPIDPRRLFTDGADAALAELAARIERARLGLRAHLREQSAGRYPPPGPADGADPEVLRP